MRLLVSVRDVSTGEIPAGKDNLQPEDSPRLPSGRFLLHGAREAEEGPRSVAGTVDVDIDAAPVKLHPCGGGVFDIRLRLHHQVGPASYLADEGGPGGVGNEIPE